MNGVAVSLFSFAVLDPFSFFTFTSFMLLPICSLRARGGLQQAGFDTISAGFAGEEL